jgi:predicted membrane protein
MHDLFLRYADHVGLVGVLLTLLAYYLLNVNKLTSDSMAYLWLNLVGSCLLLFSLLFHWNLSSVCIEIAWITISLIGLVRALRSRKQARANNLYVIEPGKRAGTK